MRDVADRVAVVTGAASGIGLAMSEAFAAAGMKVVLGDIDGAAAERAAGAVRAHGGEAFAVRADVADAGQVDRLAHRTLERYGAVHVLCNNAGVFARGTPSWALGAGEWQRIVDVNLMGVVHGIRSFLPLMIDQGTEAHVVNTASLGGVIPSGASAYAATKAAVVALSENLHVELRRSGLRPAVSVLCPGFVATGILRSLPAPADDAARRLRAHAEEALRRTGMPPADVAREVLDAIREERFWILTHRELDPFIEQRTHGLLHGEPPAMPLPPATG